MKYYINIVIASVIVIVNMYWNTLTDLRSPGGHIVQPTGFGACSLIYF